VNLLGDNIDTIKKNTETSIDASKEVGLEVNAEKTCSHQRKRELSHDIRTANRRSENVAQSKYLQTTVTHQNLIQEEIKRRMSSGNACYLSVQYLLSSYLPSTNLKKKFECKEL
jgi:hypothetical protein